MDNAESLTPVREAHVFDEKLLGNYLEDHLEGDFSDMVVRQFEGGQSNPTFHLSAGAKTYVMRKKPPGVLLKSAHAVDREYRIMTALRDTDVPVPRTYLLCEDESVVGTAFFISENVEGRVFTDPGLEDLAAQDRRVLYDNAVEVMAALHRVDWQAVGLGDYGRPGNYYARQISRWTKQYLASKTDDIPAMDGLIEWLPAHTPDAEETTLVHGDFRIGNFLVHAEEPRIAALLDWELSTLGHPIADLAHFIHYASHAHEAGTNPDIPSEAEILDRYCAVTGRAHIENWNFYMVFTLFRSAAIGQGVYKRGLDGNASSQFWARSGEAVPKAAGKAWILAQGSAKRE